MTKDSDRRSDTDTENGSVRSQRAGKLGAILCPTICALLLVFVFTVSFIGTKLAYEQYDPLCPSQHFDFTKLYIFTNNTMRRVRSMHPLL